MTWARSFDPASRRVYFYNDETQESVWDRPAGFREGELVQEVAAATTVQSFLRKARARAAAAARRAKRDLWTRCYDPTSRQAYYYNSETGESTWERPDEFRPGSRYPKLGAATRIQGMYRSLVARRLMRERLELRDRYIRCYDPNTRSFYFYDAEEDEAVPAQPPEYIPGGKSKRVDAALLVQRGCRRRKAVVAANKLRAAREERKRHQAMWIKQFDPELRVVYYYNTLTSRSVYNPPSVYVPGGSNERLDAVLVLQCAIRQRNARHRLWYLRSRANSALWHKSFDPRPRRLRGVYFRNSATKEWQWDRPPAFLQWKPGRCAETAAAETIQCAWRVMIAYREFTTRRDTKARLLWVEQHDPVRHQNYYYNTQTGQCTYDRPKGFVPGGSHPLLDAARCIQKSYRSKIARRRFRGLLSGFKYDPNKAFGPRQPPPVSRLFRRTGKELPEDTELYMVDPDNQTEGPFSVSIMRRKFRDDVVGPDTLVWVPGMAGWSPLRALPPVMRKLRAPSPPKPVNLDLVPLLPGSSNQVHQMEKLQHLLMCSKCGVLATWRCTVCNEPMCTECFEANHVDDAEKGVDLDLMVMETKLSKLASGRLQLKELDLRGQHVTLERCTALASALLSDCSLVRLDVSGDALGDAGVATIASGFEGNRNSTLRFLSLGYNECGSEGASRLAQALAHNESVEELDLSFNSIDGEGGAAIALMLRTNTALRLLNLNNNPIGDVGGRALASALLRGGKMVGYSGDASTGSNHTLRDLRLSYCGLTEVSIAHLGETFKMTASLKQVDVSYNDLTLLSARAIGSALVQYPSIETLGLCFCRLGNEGVRAVVQPLRMNHVVMTLDLSFNDVGPDGARWLTEALRRNHGVTKLNLAHNQLGVDGGAAIGALLEGNRTLEWVDVSSNGMGTEGVSRLARGLGKMQVDTLTHLDLSYNDVAVAGGRELDGAVRFNPALNQELQIIMLGNVGDPHKTRKVSLINIKPMEEESFVLPPLRSPCL